MRGAGSVPSHLEKGLDTAFSLTTLQSLLSQYKWVPGTYKEHGLAEGTSTAHASAAVPVGTVGHSTNPALTSKMTSLNPCTGPETAPTGYHTHSLCRARHPKEGDTYQPPPSPGLPRALPEQGHTQGRICSQPTCGQQPSPAVHTTPPPPRSPCPAPCRPS